MTNISPFPIPADEESRLDQLAEYQILDTSNAEGFDRLVQLASRVFSVPIVLISLVGRDQQFFKARTGLDLCETSREVSFCTHAIMHDEILYVPDALEDRRFAFNPLVLGPPYIRFYAGKPLITPSGARLGTVCLIDTAPRHSFGEEERQNLTDLAALVMDRIELHRLDYVRSVSQSRFERIAATSPDAIICSRADGLITFWNRAAESLFGYTAAEMLDRSGEIVVPDSWRHIYEAELLRLQRGERMQLEDRTIELSGLRRDGTEFPAEFSLSTWKEGSAVNVGAIVRDITERRQNEERLFRLARTDSLTSLPNRNAFQSRLKEIAASGVPVAVLLLDLDDFKDVNDTLGHAAGDKILVDVGKRMEEVCPDAIMVARLGGDEFVALLPGDDELDVRKAAAHLVATISKPYDFLGHAIEVGVSIGISLAPMHGKRMEDLVSAADLALYRAKAAGKGGFEVFAASFRQVAVARRALESELRQAFENQEFELYYQPQIDTRSSSLAGAEALLRWNHPSRGLLTPASFIAILSEKPSAAAVGDWILRSACEQAARWQGAIPSFRISVNLFESQLRSGRLLASVAESLAATGLRPGSLELELVENIVLRHDKVTLRLLHGLRKLGVGLAFDDYGTGYASLSLLKDYPVTRLKIDRSFILNIDSDPKNAAVVKAIIYLCDNFGLEVIAEGVETQEQLDFLRKNRCAMAQGYLFGKPLSASAFTTRFINKESSVAGLP